MFTEVGEITNEAVLKAAFISDKSASIPCRHATADGVQHLMQIILDLHKEESPSV